MSFFKHQSNKVQQPEPMEVTHEPLALDDEQRVKVLSPGMLVFKRFISNRLAIVGTICITAMFLFSFIGGWLMPYGEDEVFKHYVEMIKDYASVTENDQIRYTVAEGKEFPSVAQASFVLAANKKETTFSARNKQYTLEQLDDDFYIISALQEVASAGTTKDGYLVSLSPEFKAPRGFEAAFRQAIANKLESFTVNDTEYTVILQKKFYYAYISQIVASASLDIFDYISSETVATFEFQYKAQLAVLNNQTTFTADGLNFELKEEEGIILISQVTASGKTEYATISRYIVNPISSDIFLTIEFKDAAKVAIEEGKPKFTFNDGSGDKEYIIERKNTIWSIRSSASALVTLDFDQPSLTHLLGTDGNGMDILTRLMYGGRVSLMIGFIVVIIETLIGVILGGIAGYFGKWVDNLLMRLVDVFNSIPSTPLIIILGAMMDAMRIDPQIRMIYLMLILGFLGWPYIARLVRGQILSLREQEFMVAAEATGLSVNRKIFRHLVPNVIPQLIVVSTMSLGGVILTESVLSFLGLGVKYPFASWGNIINAVSNVFVMTNYWFVWIPAGFCILITVLGFNFIGDGLRDAFDPKMKR
ncbi:MAG TPA: ABC transporter permease [Clostridiales bacterium]|nr:ABC transporter permease [Clostridiales bacterium]